MNAPGRGEAAGNLPRLAEELTMRRSWFGEQVKVTMHGEPTD
jgi:hypothetical protein